LSGISVEPSSRLGRWRSWLSAQHPFPPDSTFDARRLVAARAVRAFGDGFVSVLLPAYLLSLGFEAVQVGAISTSTLLGSAALTLVVGLAAHRLRRRSLLFAAALLMAATGLAFATVHAFWPLMVVAFVGTLNPSAGDVSVFLPLEQAALPEAVSARSRTALFARYGLVGSLVGAVGALCAGLPQALAIRLSIDPSIALQAMFVLYGLLGLVSLALYRRLSPAIDTPTADPAPLRESRSIVLSLAALFSLDALGAGFVVQSILALWLFQRFDLPVATAGSIFFWTGVLSAGSYLVASRLASRIGLINTMVFTHLPSNVFLLLVPFMPTLPLAVLLLLLRSALSQMDVPTRGSYVMAVVPPAERAAAASVTSVPRSLAQAVGPLPAGYLLGLTTFGWPLVIAGAVKGIYDVLLLLLFAHRRPPEEVQPRPRVGQRAD
jgi:MFS family permease